MTFEADLRYSGQAFQISLDFTEEDLKAQGLSLLINRFDQEHEQLFTFKLGDDHEILMIRAVVKAKAKAIAEYKTGDTGASLADCKIHDSRFYYEGAWHDAGIYTRGLLHQGLVVSGPAIINEMDSTTVVLPDYEAKVDHVGNLLITPQNIEKN